MATLGTFASGQILTAAELNAIGTWTSYTPTITGVTAGNATVAASYIELNQIVFFQVRWIFGSTSAVTGPVTITYPVTANNLYQAAAGVNVYLEDSSAAADFVGVAYPDTTARFEVRAANASTTYLGATALTSAIPFTWATGDVILASGFYRK
jgi:hypothetical protein